MTAAGRHDRDGGISRRLPDTQPRSGDDLLGQSAVFTQI
ncbi:hypothetical protein [Azospirillum largimobile]